MGPHIWQMALDTLKNLPSPLQVTFIVQHFYIPKNPCVLSPLSCLPEFSN